tara:strand:- start:301 stop:540 length:240 start_codon:yes stop_codon:yes gene_type:complete
MKKQKHSLALTAIHGFFSQDPCCTTYFLPTAAKSKQKMPIAKLCSSSNYLANLAGRFQSFPTTENSIFFPANCPTKFTK